MMKYALIAALFLLPNMAFSADDAAFLALCQQDKESKIKTFGKDSIYADERLCPCVLEELKKANAQDQIDKMLSKKNYNATSDAEIACTYKYHDIHDMEKDWNNKK